MKSFKAFLNEETMPYAATAKGVMDISDNYVRDGLNSQIAGVTSGKFVTPYIALERVSKALANFHIFIPRHSFLQGDSGMFVWPINQFGIKIGQREDGTFVRDGEVLKDTSKGIHIEGEDNKVVSEPITEVEEKFSIFFEYRQTDCGMFAVFSELVTQDELDEILADLEAELNGEEGEEDEDEEELNEQKFTNRATNAKPEAPVAKADTPMKDRATTPGASTPVPSGSFSPRVPTRSTKDLDQMNRDAEGNTVVEGSKDNKEKKKQALIRVSGGKKLRDIRTKMKDGINKSFDVRNLKQVAEQKHLDEI